MECMAHTVLFDAEYLCTVHTIKNETALSEVEFRYTKAYMCVVYQDYN